MIKSKSGLISLIPQKNLFILKVENEEEGTDLLYLTTDELVELKQFLQELPLDLPDSSLNFK